LPIPPFFRRGESLDLIHPIEERLEPSLGDVDDLSAEVNVPARDTSRVEVNSRPS
jgi:hypothetical protein